MLGLICVLFEVTGGFYCFTSVKKTELFKNVIRWLFYFWAMGVYLFSRPNHNFCSTETIEKVLIGYFWIQSSKESGEITQLIFRKFSRRFEFYVAEYFLTKGFSFGVRILKNIPDKHLSVDGVAGMLSS